MKGVQEMYPTILPVEWTPSLIEFATKLMAWDPIKPLPGPYVRDGDYAWPTREELED